MLSVFLHPSFNFWMGDPVFMKLVMHIMTPDSISTTYFINPSHQSVCLYVYPLSLLGNGLVETLTLQRILTQQWKNCWTIRFLCGPCRVKESRRFFPEFLVICKPWHPSQRYLYYESLSSSEDILQLCVDTALPCRVYNVHMSPEVSLV
jgi:hypothetical protein